MTLISLAAILGACGYHGTLAPSAGSATAGKSGGSERARVSVIALRNDSPEPWLDRIVTDALRREVGTRARLRLTDAHVPAALQVRGRIRPLDIVSKSFSSFVAALEYSLTAL